MNQQQQQTEEDYCGAHGWEPLGDDCDCGVKEEYQWWGHTYTDERGNTISFFNATEKWIEENAEYKYNEYGRLDYFKDRRDDLVK
tara:strand:- start:266 stop:520 length:255 start_codon:yes stop_codon:yes gene_type:complete